MRAVSGCLILLLVTSHMSVARKFTKCQFLRELRKGNVAKKDLATFLCIAQHESGLNTAARGGPNRDRSYDNGIFQINDRYWCKNRGVGGSCNINCAKLRDNNVADDIKCALKIKKSQGFTAWVVYRKYCTRASLPSC
ncbi:lysozyme C-like [Cryptotermes secundus]|uniref:lysozyme C-like n=1 Tax=Cryptotermes secundus TaxID=105785 RepID=UPI000CD7C9B4|nr:lysozyme C-like [Cryptotermes secundus]XP_033607472.1 lysozyme C-like [Cryptotermes secundus]XP_033607473.1 lysozyme C-like [Cryptotermes secundus]